MWTVYILKSELDGSFYYGSSSDQSNRLRAHNSGKVKSTKAKRPWKPLYTEQYSTHTEALARERFFKFDSSRGNTGAPQVTVGSHVGPRGQVAPCSRLSRERRGNLLAYEALA